MTNEYYLVYNVFIRQLCISMFALSSEGSNSSDVSGMRPVIKSSGSSYNICKTMIIKLTKKLNVMHSVYATVNIRLKGYLQIFSCTKSRS